MPAERRPLERHLSCIRAALRRRHRELGEPPVLPDDQHAQRRSAHFDPGPPLAPPRGLTPASSAPGVNVNGRFT